MKCPFLENPKAKDDKKVLTIQLADWMSACQQEPIKSCVCK